MCKIYIKHRDHKFDRPWLYMPQIGSIDDLSSLKDM